MATASEMRKGDRDQDGLPGGTGAPNPSLPCQQRPCQALPLAVACHPPATGDPILLLSQRHHQVWSMRPPWTRCMGSCERSSGRDSPHHAAAEILRDHDVRMTVRGLPEQVWLQRSGAGEPPAGNALSNTPAAGKPLSLLPSHTPGAVLRTAPYLHHSYITKVMRQ